MYAWEVRNGVIVWPLCFWGYGQFGGRALLLNFDETGVLQTSRLLKRDGNWYVNKAYAPDLPEDVRPIETMPGWPETRPMTGPAAPDMPPPDVPPADEAREVPPLR